MLLPIQVHNHTQYMCKENKKKIVLVLQIKKLQIQWPITLGKSPIIEWSVLIIY